MKKLLWSVLLLLGMASFAWTAEDYRVITDMAGREVKVPKEIRTVLSRCPMGTILMYSVNPDKIAGLNWEPTEFEKKYLSKKYLALPMLGGWYATNKGNVEEIIKTAPSILFSSAPNAAKSQNAKDQADRLQKQLKIPVVMLDAGIYKLPAIYRFVGKLLGEEARCEILAKYVEKTLAEIKSKQSQIPKNKILSVYYAEGQQGLNTDPSKSPHSELIEVVGAKNAATVDAIQGVGGMGRSQVSPEQLIIWDPDIILTCHDQGFGAEVSTYNAVLKDKRFTGLKAVQSGNVYEVPYIPFNIADRPPSANRVIGLKWMANLFYPDVYKYDMKKEFKDFYKLFFGVTLTDEDMAQVLKYSHRK